MNKNIKKVVAATVVAGLAVAPVAAQTTAPVAQAAEQAQSKHVSAKFVQNEKGNFVQVTATQDVQAAKVTISVDGKGQYTVNVGDLKKGETKLVPFNVDAKVGNGFAPKALPKTAAVTEHVTISKTINSHLVRVTVSYKYEDGKADVKPGNKGGDKVDKDQTPGDRPKLDDLVGGGNAPAPAPTPAPSDKPGEGPTPAPAPGTPGDAPADKPTEPGNATPAPSDKPGDAPSDKPGKPALKPGRNMDGVRIDYSTAPRTMKPGAKLDPKDFNPDLFA